MVTKEKLKLAKDILNGKKRKASNMTMAHVDAQANEYMLLKIEENKIADKLSKISKELKEHIPTFEETTTDDKDNMFLTLPSGVTLKLEKRISTSLKEEEAIDFAKRRGLAKKLIYTEERADAQGFEQLTLSGVISDDEYETLISRKESVALKVTGKK